jgi:hypothetical protein
MHNEPQQFPELHARNLIGQRFVLPADFAGERAVAIVAFERWHQRLVDEWNAWLNDIAPRYPGTEVYEVPVLSHMYMIARPMIDGGMAAAIPSEYVRSHTLTVYTDVRRTRQALGLPDTRTIGLFLVGRNGTIYWRGRGAFSEAQAAALEETLGSST